MIIQLPTITTKATAQYHHHHHQEQFRARVSFGSIALPTYFKNFTITTPKSFSSMGNGEIYTHTYTYTLKALWQRDEHKYSCGNDYDVNTKYCCNSIQSIATQHNQRHSSRRPVGCARTTATTTTSSSTTTWPSNVE